MFTLTYLPFLLPMVTFLIFGGAMIVYFRHRGNPQPGKKLLGLSVLACTALQMPCVYLYSQATQTQIYLGAGLYLAALFLFFVTIATFRKSPPDFAFSSRRPSHFIRTGSFRISRHPFYTSYILAWVAGVLYSGMPLLALTVVVMTWQYYRAAKLEENSFLTGEFKDEYADFQRQTGMFYPRLSTFCH